MVPARNDAASPPAASLRVAGRAGLKRLAVPLVLLLAGLHAHAQAPAAPAQVPATRIGYVDMKRLLDTAPQVLEARARLRQEFAERDARLKADEQRLAETETRLKRDGAILSKADAERLAAEVDALRRGSARAREQLREDLNRRSKEELDKRWPAIYGVVVEYARERGYDLVVEAPVLYASPSVDITDAVLERLRRNATAGTPPR